MKILSSNRPGARDKHEIKYGDLCSPNSLADIRNFLQSDNASITLNWKERSGEQRHPACKARGLSGHCPEHIDEKGGIDRGGGLSLTRDKGQGGRYLTNLITNKVR